MILESASGSTLLVSALSNYAAVSKRHSRKILSPDQHDDQSFNRAETADAYPRLWAPMELPMAVPS